MIDKHRDNYIDIAKAISIILIIRIHTEVFSELGVPYPIIIVPLFFFMSGFYDRAEKSFQEYFVKSIRCLILPALIWLMIAFVYLGVLHLIDDGEISIDIDLMHPKLSNPTLWFLFALFYAKMITWALIRIKCSPIVLFCISLFLGWMGCLYNLPLMMSPGLCALPLYYLGKICYVHIGAIIKKWHVVVIGVFALFYIHMAKFPCEIVTLKDENWIPYYPIAFFVIVLTFSPFLYLCHSISKFGCSFMVEYGKRTLGILLTHSLFLHTAFVILNRVLEKGSDIWIICGLLIYCLVCLLTYWITIVIEKYAPVLLGKK